VSCSCRRFYLLLFSPVTEAWPGGSSVFWSSGGAIMEKTTGASCNNNGTPILKKVSSKVKCGVTYKKCVLLLSCLYSILTLVLYLYFMLTPFRSVRMPFRSVSSFRCRHHHHAFRHLHPFCHLGIVAVIVILESSQSSSSWLLPQSTMLAETLFLGDDWCDG
jgi:hypothetical protein